jgi:hypothetical protein
VVVVGSVVVVLDVVTSVVVVSVIVVVAGTVVLVVDGVLVVVLGDVVVLGAVVVLVVGWVVVVVVEGGGATGKGKVVVVVVGLRGVVPAVPGSPEPSLVTVASVNVDTVGVVAVTTAPVLVGESPNVVWSRATGRTSDGWHSRAENRLASPSTSTTDANTYTVSPGPRWSRTASQTWSGLRPIKVIDSPANTFPNSGSPGHPYTGEVSDTVPVVW